VARLLQTLSSCRTEYFGRLGMVKVSFGSKPENLNASIFLPLYPQQRTSPRRSISRDLRYLEDLPLAELELVFWSSRPRNSSCLSQSRYVLITSDLQ
jgi:hypothetical protein